MIDVVTAKLPVQVEEGELDPRRELLRVHERLLRSEQERARLADQLAKVELERTRIHDQLLHFNCVEAAGTLAAGLAHDMNNVLAAIMCFAESLLDVRHAPHVRADLEQIVAQAERGAGLTRSLLAFSRKGQYRKQVLVFDDVIRRVASMLSHTLPKTITIETDLASSAAHIDGDASQLIQTIVNLGLNAADAMANKGTLRITSDVVVLDGRGAETLGLPAGRYLRALVIDTGCGMDEATRARVFEPFFTTKAPGKGTGLGLSLAWGVVKGHHGAIAVESKPGQGTTVCFHIPVTDAVPPEAPRMVEPRKPEVTTVLVVDDEPAVRAGTTRILERLGYKVRGASNGAEAMRIISASHADIGLIILDMRMPVMGGAECFHLLRQITSVPVLVATGHAIDEEVQAMVAHGATVIEKPFGATALLVEMARILNDERIG